MGRISTFNKQDADEIVKRLSHGEPLSLICDDEWLPCEATVRNWAKADPAFASEIARARNVGWDRMAADTVRIADNPELVILPDGTKIVNDAQRDKLRVWTRLELLKRWDPKRYAETKNINLGGAVGVVAVTATDPVEAAKEYRRLIDGNGEGT